MAVEQPIMPLPNVTRPVAVEQPIINAGPGRPRHLTYDDHVTLGQRYRDQGNMQKSEMHFSTARRLKREHGNRMMREREIDMQRLNRLREQEMQDKQEKQENKILLNRNYEHHNYEHH